MRKSRCLIMAKMSQATCWQLMKQKLNRREFFINPTLLQKTETNPKFPPLKYGCWPPLP